MRGYDDVELGQLRLRVEEQFDTNGDLVWVLLLSARTYSRGALDRLAEQVGGELEFVPAGRGMA
jgi:hypothetical protein